MVTLYGSTFVNEKELKESKIDHKIKLEYYKVKNEARTLKNNKISKFGINVVKTEYTKDEIKVEEKEIKYLSSDEERVNNILEILKNNKKKKDEDNSLYEDVGSFSSFQAKSSIDNEPDDCSPTNAGSIILLFKPVDDCKFLLLGDANRAAIMDAISNNANLAGCKIKVPHHGSKHNLTSGLIDKLAPSCAIISAKGSQKHPSRGVVHCLSNHCNVYSTHKSKGLFHTSAPVNNPAIPLKKKQ